MQSYRQQKTQQPVRKDVSILYRAGQRKKSNNRWAKTEGLHCTDNENYCLILAIHTINEHYCWDVTKISENLLPSNIVHVCILHLTQSNSCSATLNFFSTELWPSSRAWDFGNSSAASTWIIASNKTATIKPDRVEPLTAMQWFTLLTYEIRRRGFVKFVCVYIL